MSSDIKKFCLGLDDTLRQALETIDKTRLGIVLVVDEKGILVGTVTDGDIRRFLLKNQDFATPLRNLYSSHPIVMSEGTSESELLQLMNTRKIRQVPLVSKDGRPVKIVEITRLSNLGQEKSIAVIMAGGKGSRLYPLTKDTPKPMLKVGDIPVLENTVKRLVESGVPDIFISVFHEASVIKDYFMDGKKFDANINYLEEKEMLGNAGSLKLLPSLPREPFLVINGDVLTKTNFQSILSYHRQHQSVMTVGAVEYNFAVPYGVLRLANHYLLGIDEKPKQTVHCNAGIYVLNPQLLEFIPERKQFSMTQLLSEIFNRGLPVTACPIHEYWLDIGQKEDFERAQKEYIVNFSQ